MEHNFDYSGIEVFRCDPGPGFYHWCQIYPDDETLEGLPTFKEGSWWSRRGLLEVYEGWTDAASAGDLEEVY